MKAKLDLPGWKHVGSNLSGSGSADQRIRRTIVLNVERVKEFRPERNEKSLPNWEILEHREVRVIHGRRSQGVSAKVSVGVYWYREGTGG
jgi:hypothetical protein